MKFRTLLSTLLLSAGLSSVTAKSFFCDEYIVSLGLARHNFREFRLDNHSSPDFFSQHYKAISPVLQMQWNKALNDRWHSLLQLECHYDFSMDSENALGNGRTIFDAHSWSTDLKWLAMFETDPKHHLRVGMGAGIANYALLTELSVYEDYTHHTRLMGPVFRADKEYQFLGRPGSFSAEVARLDFYYFQGVSYSLKNTLWFKKNDQVEQGLSIQYSYWNLDQGKLGNRKWMRDFHGISWSIDLKFR